jgi:hypothetical protein
MMRKIELMAVLAALAIATPAMAQGRGRGNGGVPPGQRPAAGMCRIWIDGVPPGQQPAPTDCATAAARVPANGRIIYGDRTNGSRRGVYDQNGQVIPRSSQDCVQQIDRNGQVRTVCPYDDRRDDGIYSRRDRNDGVYSRRDRDDDDRDDDRIDSRTNRGDDRFENGKAKVKKQKHKGHGRP